VCADQGKARKARKRAESGTEPSTRRQRRRLETLPPKPGQKWARFESLAMMSGTSTSWVDKQARSGKFESFKPGPNMRVGDVESFNAMMQGLAAEGPRFGEAPPVKPGSRPRGRPPKIKDEREKAP
jgi:hypothetical protein